MARKTVGSNPRYMGIHDRPDKGGIALDMDRLQVGRAAGQLAGVDARIEGERRSVLLDFVRWCAAILVRDSGF